MRARRRRVSFLTLSCYALLLLGFFTTDDFVGVTHALAFVRLRRTEVANFGSNLTDQLLVDTLDQDIGLAGGLSDDAGRQFVINRMGEAEGQGQHLALGLRFVTNADQLELALEALADADYHVVHQSTGGTSHGASLLVAVTRSKTQLTAVLDHFDRRMDLELQSTFGALDGQLLTSQFDFNAGRQLDGVLSNARHADSP